MAQACRDDLHSGTANGIVNSLHTEVGEEQLKYQSLPVMRLVTSSRFREASRLLNGHLCFSIFCY